MQTLDFLDRLNGALADAWAPYLNKRYKFVDMHNIVPSIIRPTLQGTGLRYTTWHLVPEDTDADRINTYDLHLFTLRTDGFVSYKNQRYTHIGKWTKAPRFEVAEGLMAPTVGEVIQLGFIQKLEKRIVCQKTHVSESRTQLSDAERLLYQLENELYQLKQSADTVRSEDSNLQEKQ